MSAAMALRIKALEERLAVLEEQVERMKAQKAAVTRSPGRSRKSTMTFEPVAETATRKG